MNRPTLIIAALTLTAAGVATGLAIGHTNTPEPKAHTPAACLAAIDHANLISANARMDWAQGQELVNIGRESVKNRPEAQQRLYALESQISAREDILETAQAQYEEAVKGCTP